MATADEIRRRVRDADEARIEQRAKLAADVATANDRRDDLRKQLGEAERALGDAVTAAEQAMTTSELASFLGTRTATVTEWKSSASAPKRRRRKSTGASTQETGQTQTTDQQVDQQQSVENADAGSGEVA